MMCLLFNILSIGFFVLFYCRGDIIIFKQLSESRICRIFVSDWPGLNPSLLHQAFRVSRQSEMPTSGLLKGSLDGFFNSPLSKILISHPSVFLLLLFLSPPPPPSHTCPLLATVFLSSCFLYPLWLLIIFSRSVFFSLSLLFLLCLFCRPLLGSGQFTFSGSSCGLSLLF